MTRIDETLRKIAASVNRLPGKDPAPHPAPYLPGDPNCPRCHGIGFLRRELPVTDPNFGKVEICTCRLRDVGEAVRSQLYQFSNLEALKHLTFENFQPRGRGGLQPHKAQSLEAALSHARRFAGELKGWLLLLGGPGCGKTHLAAAIANQAVSYGVPTLFLTVPDLLDWLRFSYDSRETSFEARFDEIRNVALLVLDDFGTQNATAWAQEKLFQILNHRYINRLPLVVTSNLGLDEIEERLRSRLRDPELVQKIFIQAPDYRHPAEDSGSPELSSLSLHRQRTFAAFSLREAEALKPAERKSLETALRTARQYAANPTGWLVFTGGYGSGKTHLAAAIGNQRAEEGSSVMFVVVPDLLDYLRAAFGPSSGARYDERFEEVRTTPMLILDDLGSQSTTAWAREKLFQILNYRYNAELPTIITTPEPVDKMDARIASRVNDRSVCMVVEISAPPFQGVRRPSKPARSSGRTRTAP